MERQNLHTAAVQSPAGRPAHHGRGRAGQLGIAVGLNLDLHRKIAGRIVQQFVEEHRCLARRGAIAVAQASVP